MQGGLSPSALSIKDAAQVLQAAGARHASADNLEADIESGAPTSADATLNLVHHAARMVTRLAVAMGDKGCLSLFGDRAETHRLFAEHLCAEYRVQTQGRGRTVDEWKIKPAQFDNHWLDCLVGCAVAASMDGITLDGIGPRGLRPERRVAYIPRSMRIG